MRRRQGLRLRLDQERLPRDHRGSEVRREAHPGEGRGGSPKELKTEVIKKGDGATLQDGDAVQVNYLGQEWDSTKPFDDSFGSGKPFGLVIGAGMVIPGWEQGLTGQKVGSRVELVIPPDLAYGQQGKGDIKPDSTLVFVADILSSKKVPVSAKGTAVAQDDSALPKVGTNTDGKAPSMEIPKSDPPKKLVSDYVLESDGEAVKESDTVVVNYEAYLWKGAEKFDSTYASGKVAAFPLSNIAVKGLKDGLIGKKVGSRVLLVIPPDQGFGQEAEQTIPAGSTLVWSVDILEKM